LHIEANATSTAPPQAAQVWTLNLNTEMGLVIESPRLAAAISDTLDRGIDRMADEAILDQRGDLEWVELTAPGEVRYTTEPGTTFSKRFGTGFMSWPPIDWLL